MNALYKNRNAKHVQEQKCKTCKYWACMNICIYECINYACKLTIHTLSRQGMSSTATGMLSCGSAWAGNLRKRPNGNHMGQTARFFFALSIDINMKYFSRSIFFSRVLSLLFVLLSRIYLYRLLHSILPSRPMF
jgi:hypothetical protein